MRPSSASPRKKLIPISSAAVISGGVSSSMASEPAAWKPPMQTGMPAFRNGRAKSIARGNWFDWTPIRPTIARPPSALTILISLSG